MQGEHLLGRGRARRARPSPAPRGPGRRSPRARRRRAPGRAAAAPPRSRCCRTGCRGSPGAIRGWSGSTIVAARIASSPGDASTGKVLTLCARRDRRAGRALALERRDEAPGDGLDHDVGREQARRPAPRRARARAPPRSCCGRRRGPARARGSSSGSQRSRARPRSAARALELEGLAHPAVGELADRRRPELEPALDAPGGARPRPAGTGPSRPQLGLRLGLEHALEPQVVEGRRQLLRVGRRVDDPERGRGRVLGRAGRVRVERVALVEQRARPAARAPRASLALLAEQLGRASRRRSAARARPCAAAGARASRVSTGTQARYG